MSKIEIDLSEVDISDRNNLAQDIISIINDYGNYVNKFKYNSDILYIIEEDF